MTKRNVGEEGIYFSLCVSSREFRARTQGRNLEAGTETEAMEKCYLLASFPWLIYLAFLWHTGSQARGSTIQSDLVFPISVINQENAPQACPGVNLVGTFSQLRFPLSK